jgi:hypothetical protein
VAEGLLRYLKSSFEEGNPSLYVDVFDWLNQQHSITLAISIGRHYVKSLPGIPVIQGVPMEKQRVEADQAEVQKYFGILQGLLPGMPASMVINLDTRHGVTLIKKR